MKTLTTLALSALLAAPMIASADTGSKTTTTTTTTQKKATDKPASTKISDADLQVMAQMHHVNQMEIDLGKVAQTKSTTPGVKSYGKMLVTDHSSADKDLLALARKHHQSIPAYKPTNEADQKDDKDDKDMAAKVKAEKGADFDKDFLSMMVTGHEKVLATLDTAMGTITSDELKELIQNVKPTLQKHEDQARDLQKSSPQAMK